MSAKETVEYKNIYLECRKKKGLTREQAVEKMPTISVDKLERIENERCNVTPDNVIELTDAYGAPNLCNYYCTHDCEIGKRFSREVHIKDLSQIVVETLSLLNTMEVKKNKLLEIAFDGQITNDELRDFISITRDLDRISMTVDSLKLWTEQMKSSDAIDSREYERIKKEIYSGGK